MFDSLRPYPTYVFVFDYLWVSAQLRMLQVRNNDALECAGMFGLKDKGKGKGQDTCYSAAYMSQTRDQQRFYNIGGGS